MQIPTLYYFFGSLVLLANLATVASRDHRLAKMAIVIAITWGLSIYADTYFPRSNLRLVLALVDLASFIVLFALATGGPYEPNKWAKIAAGLQFIGLPAHLFHDLVGPYYFTLWINVAWTLMLLVVIYAGLERLWITLVMKHRFGELPWQKQPDE